MSDSQTQQGSYQLPRAKPPLAVASLIISMAVGALGNGMMFVYVPVRLGALDYDPAVAGWLVTAMSAGSFVGCLLTGRIMRAVGHARAYMTMIAAAVLAHATVGLFVDPYTWAASRFLYGFAAAGFFIASQSWLNHACPNEWRGRVMSIFYMSYVICLGLGSFILGFVDINTSVAPLMAVCASALALIPVGTTNLRLPPPPDTVKIALRGVWSISPVGLIGVLVVGGLSMLVHGFAPIYAEAIGYSQFEISMLLFFMQFGMIAIQTPLGALSDRIDRRYVLIIATVIIVAFSAYSANLDMPSLWVLIIVFGLWGGATESIYSIASAHANDRAEPQYYVSVSMTLLFCWSFSGMVFPAVGSAVVAYFGITAYMYVATGMAVGYGLFVAYRLFQREAVPDDDQETFQPLAAQAVYSPELAAPVDDDINQKTPKP